MINKSLLICDLDNTLYDWVAYFVPSFYAMVDVAVDILQCDRQTLLNDFREIHQRYHDSEHPFSLLETRTVKQSYPNETPEYIAKILDPAFHAFNTSRKSNLHLHPGVRETLETLQEAGVVLVAHTESRFYGAVDRMKRLDLFQYFSRLYCRERSLSSRPNSHQNRRPEILYPTGKIRELQRHEWKPNPAILGEICALEGLPISAAAYVGDSMAKDVLMAKRCGIFAIWAAYGAEHEQSTYDALVKVSHWTPLDIQRERQLMEEAELVNPDYIARESFAEVLEALQIEARPLNRPWANRY